MKLYDENELYSAYKKDDKIVLYNNDTEIAEIFITDHKFNSKSPASIPLTYFFIKECGILFDSFGNCSYEIKKTVMESIKLFSNIIKPISIYYDGKKLQSGRETEIFLKYYWSYGEIKFGEDRWFRFHPMMDILWTY